METSFVVVDVQMCGRYDIKELAYYKDGVTYSYLLKPQTKNLTSFEKSQNKWLQNNLHCLDWEVGFYDYQKVRSQLIKETWDVDNVFAKGLEKCQRLESFLERKVTNLEQFDCPKYEHLKNFDGQCTSAGVCGKHRSGNYCAEKHARAFGRWYDLKQADGKIEGLCSHFNQRLTVTY